MANNKEECFSNNLLDKKKKKISIILGLYSCNFFSFHWLITNSNNKSKIKQLDS